MASITRFKLRRPDDFHLHLREDITLAHVLPHTNGVFGRALVMPNLRIPIRYGTQAQRYGDEIRMQSEGKGFTPLMTIKLAQDTGTRAIETASEHAVAAKIYPEGVTTNSEDGVRDITRIDDDVFKAMVDRGMVLCIHAEEPGAFSMDRERSYLRKVEEILRKHPQLKVVIEHVTTAEALMFVEKAGPNVAATITVHHLLLTLDDVVGDKLQPHNFCKPIAKYPEDRNALVRAAISGNPKFFLGTDSAPHSKDTKECASGCAGCFTAPVAVPLLVEIFGSDRLEALERFASTNGATFYGLKPNQDFITLERTEWQVPESYPIGGGRVVVPFKAGERLAWQVTNS